MGPATIKVAHAAGRVSENNNGAGGQRVGRETMDKVFHEPVEGSHFPKVVVPVPKGDIPLERVDLV